MNYWIVKGRASRNDFDAWLRPGRPDKWRTAKPPKDWAAGDRLFFWRAARSSQVVGMGQLTKTEHREPRGTDTEFSVRYLSRILKHPVGIEELRTDHVLRATSFLKAGPSGTLFPLTQRQGKRLYALLSRNNSPIRNIWPLSKPEIDLRSAPTLDSDSGDVSESLLEGATHEIRLTRYERDFRARQLCLNHFGNTCSVCEVDFTSVYGIPERVIHVHHTVPLSSIRKRYRVDPVKDLRPLFPNCHAIVHLTQPPRSIEDLRRTVRKRRFLHEMRAMKGRLAPT
jgi:hypothetical protein